MQLQKISRYLEAKYPLHLQESYDNSGLIYGHPETEITGVLISLDVTEAVVEEAIASNCNLIIAHHPIVFKGIKRLNGQGYVERVLERCIQNRIALYAIHTNLDNHIEGVNGRIAAKLGLKECRILRPMDQLLYKLEVYVPKENFEVLNQALTEAGAGQIGNYKDCYFRTSGTGAFTPTANAKPHIGKLEVSQEVQEYKLEYVVERHQLPNVLSAMINAHPYEEVAYHVLPTQNIQQKRGAGMLGTLAEPIETKLFLAQVKEIFGCGCIKHTAIVQETIQTVALCGGAGSFLLPDAISAKADLYISSDFKYHEFFDADQRIVIADIGHYESEQFTSELLAEQLTENFPNFAVRLTKLNTNPVNYL